jgi:hypothetical protein
MDNMTEGIALTPLQMQTQRNFVDGRIAEALIEQLFLSQGYEVFRFGIENVAPNLPYQLRHSIMTNSIIRNMPDFIVRKDETAYPIEVKFRGIGQRFDLKSLEKRGIEYLYDGVFFIIVTLSETRCEFKCITIEELKEGRQVDGGPGLFLAERPEFSFNHDVLDDFRSYAWNIFNGYKGK